MNARLLIACAAGIAAGFLLPLPAAAPWVRKSPATRFAISESTAPDVFVLSVEDCGTVLETLLRESDVNTLPPEQQEFAVANLLTILHENPDDAAFLKSRRLPAWLLAGAWLEKPEAVPGSLRTALSTMPAGFDAARRIARTIAKTDDAKARAFAATLPAAWRSAMREAVLLGLATREPLRALRESRIDESRHEDLAFAAARSGPMDQAVRAIAEYVDNDFPAIKPMLALLHARDAARTAELVAATEDPKLQKWLNEVTVPESPAQPAAAVLLSPQDASSGDMERAVQELGFQAVQNPAAAGAAWAALPEGKAKDQAAVAIAAALAERDAAAAFAWADKNSPQSSFEVFRVLRDADPLAAVTAALRLPEGNPLREQLLRGIQMKPGDTRVPGIYGTAVVPAVLRELPPDLQKLLTPPAAIPFEGVKPAQEKRDPFDGQLR